MTPFCLLFSSLIVAIIAYILYIFTMPHYNVGDGFIYYEKHLKHIEEYMVNKNRNKLFNDNKNYVYIETEDNFTLYIEQCIGIKWNTFKTNKIIQPILFVNGGPGIPPNQCPLFLSLIANKINNDKYYYIPYIFHQRGTGKSSRLYSKNQSFSNWNEKSNALNHLHENLGIYQQILDIERIRKYLFQFYQHKTSKNTETNKISLIGHSFGAIFSSLYAAEFTMNIDRLILISGAPLLNFNVFMPKYDIFSMIKTYLPNQIHIEFDEWSSQFVNFWNLMELNETEIIKIYRKFVKYFDIANKKYVKVKQFKHSDCNNNEGIGDMNINNIGGWMSIAIYYDMGMWHFWENKINENICKYKSNISVLVLHSEYDIQTIDASYEYLKIFQCVSISKDIISSADHTIVYHNNQHCLHNLIDKIIPTIKTQIN